MTLFRESSSSVKFKENVRVSSVTDSARFGIWNFATKFKHSKTSKLLLMLMRMVWQIEEYQHHNRCSAVITR